jgi:hypothetical protein
MIDSCKVHPKKKIKTHRCKKVQKQEHIKYETPSAMRISMQSFKIDLKKISSKVQKCKVQRCKTKYQKRDCDGFSLNPK